MTSKLSKAPVPEPDLIQDQDQGDLDQAHDVTSSSRSQSRDRKSHESRSRLRDPDIAHTTDLSHALQVVDTLRRAKNQRIAGLID